PTSLSVILMGSTDRARWRPRTQCEHHRDSAQNTGPLGPPVVGAYIPECDENGLYVPKQCHDLSGYCWCVDSSGQERSGTRTGPGSPSIDCRISETGSVNLILNQRTFQPEKLLFTTDLGFEVCRCLVSSFIKH
uniref:Thyroglobulin type-1 domain-containing protein n=1 Tax=Poecilia mexicana TaxID=48701 RepID=A0A3B3XCC8_9TELE